MLPNLTIAGSGLKCLLYSEQRDVLFIADGEGYIYAYTVAANGTPEQMMKIQTNSKSCIRSLCLSTGGTYMVAGAVDGSLSILEMGKPRQERFTKQIATFQGRPNVSIKSLSLTVHSVASLYGETAIRRSSLPQRMGTSLSGRPRTAIPCSSGNLTPPVPLPRCSGWRISNIL
jgi:hypothetical protein